MVALPLLWFQWQAPIRDVRTSAGDPSVSAAYYQPLLAFLDRQAGPPPETEAPATLPRMQLPRLFDVECRRPTQPYPDADWETRFWARATVPLGDDPVLHASVLTYLSDVSGGLAAWHDGRSHSGASLDHAVWFHRPVRLDDWVLGLMRDVEGDGKLRTVTITPMPYDVLKARWRCRGHFFCTSDYGDNHPICAGSVVRAMASAKDGAPHVEALFADEIAALASADQPVRDAAWRAFAERLDDEWRATVVRATAARVSDREAAASSAACTGVNGGVSLVFTRPG